MTPQEILALPMQNNDAGAATIKEYLVALVAEVWLEEEGFSGKRPFGNSGWKHDIYEALVTAGVIEGTYSEYKGERYYDGTDEDEKADALIKEAIQAL